MVTLVWSSFHSHFPLVLFGNQFWTPKTIYYHCSVLCIPFLTSLLFTDEWNHLILSFLWFILLNMMPPAPSRLHWIVRFYPYSCIIVRTATYFTSILFNVVTSEYSFLIFACILSHSCPIISLSSWYIYTKNLWEVIGQISTDRKSSGLSTFTPWAWWTFTQLPHYVCCSLCWIFVVYFHDHILSDWVPRDSERSHRTMALPGDIDILSMKLKGTPIQFNSGGWT